MGRANIFSGDNHDIETWLDFFVKKHLTSGGDNYTVNHYWEHFHSPITTPIDFPANNYLFIRDIKIFSLDEDIQSWVIFENEDTDDWTFWSPAIAVRANGNIIYNTFDKIENTVIRRIIDLSLNIHFLQIYGYLITIKV